MRADCSNMKLDHILRSNKCFVDSVHKNIRLSLRYLFLINKIDVEEVKQLTLTSTLLMMRWMF